MSPRVSISREAASVDATARWSWNVEARAYVAGMASLPWPST